MAKLAVATPWVVLDSTYGHWQRVLILYSLTMITVLSSLDKYNTTLGMYSNILILISPPPPPLCLSFISGLAALGNPSFREGPPIDYYCII
jgi:hypothetical protein